VKDKHSIQDYLNVIRNGIKSEFKEGQPKKVVIVGAGMAGLVAGYELKACGPQSCHSRRPTTCGWTRLHVAVNRSQKDCMPKSVQCGFRAHTINTCIH